MLPNIFMQMPYEGHQGNMVGSGVGYQAYAPNSCFISSPRARWSVTKSQMKLLEATYTRDNYPSKLLRSRLAQEIGGVSDRQVQVWFQTVRSSFSALDRSQVLVP